MKIIDNKFIIGQNAHDNWNILDISLPKYYFFHLSSFSSCFVILKTEIEPNIDDIIMSAKICKNNTKYKNYKDIYVDYCICKNVIKTDKIGEIQYKSNKKVKKIKI